MALQKKYNLPPPPNPDADVNDYAWRDWFRQLRDYIVSKGSILWSQIDFIGSNITDIVQRSHQDLQNLQGGNALLDEYYHFTNVQHTDLTDGGNTTLHYHASDRDLANATGTLAVNRGGTGQTSYTDGQLLIGNTTGNTLTKSTLTAGSGVTITNGTGSITISATGLGGDVVGPASATDNAIARFDGTTGKLIQNSVAIVDDSGNVSGVPTITDINYVDFDTTYSTTLTEGRLGWDGNNTLGLGMAGGNVIQHIGEDQFFYCKATSAITKGQVVMFTGAVGASGVPTGAPATGITDSTYIMGIAAESIALNGFGLVQSFGTLRNVNTSGYADGDILWYNPSVAGGMTKTKPSAPNLKVQMAAVINGGSVGGGTILIRITFGSVLGNTDSNVEFGTLNTNDLIQYNGTYWTNVANTSVSVGTATNADHVKTVSTATNANYYLTFVDSDNGTAAYEAVYTDAGITYNPSTNSITSGVSGGTF